MENSVIFRYSSLCQFIFVCLCCTVVNVQSLFDSEECGLIDDDFVGDLRTQVPWMASIFRKSEANCNDWVLWKSGYIIGPSTVVMSGRHFWNYTTNAKKDATNSKGLPIRCSEFLVGVGVLSDDLREADFYTHYYQVQNIIPHYRSYKKYSAFDIAVIQLKGKIKFNAYVKPICISNGWNVSPVQNFSSIISAPALKAGFGSNGGFQHLYKNPVVLHSYPLDKDCSTDLKQKTPLADVSHEELPIKRCVDLDSGLSFQRNDRWYLAALMTGGILPDPEAEAWTFFSPLEKTYYWINQNLMCAPLNFTCYEGKCIQLPNNVTSSGILLACGETENKYENIVEAQEKCVPSDSILRNWCIDCPDVESDMLDKGEESSATATTTPKSQPITSHPETNSNYSIPISTTIPIKHKEGTKISISPSNIFVPVPNHSHSDGKATPVTIELSSSKSPNMNPIVDSDAIKTNSNAENRQNNMCSLLNFDSTMCKLIKTGKLFK